MNKNLKPLLQDLTILVTRPKPQGQILCRYIEEAGGKAIFLPTIEILPLANPTKIQEYRAKLGQYDWLIFISPQSVYQSIQWIRPMWETLSTYPKLAAIGQGTADALSEEGFVVDLMPFFQWTSEGLLEVDEFQAIEGKKIAIIKGIGGRAVLKDELSKRGALVTEIEVYKRELPKVNRDLIQELLQKNTINAIVITSNDVLKNLTVLLGDEGYKLILDIPLIVISERIQRYAKELGATKIFIAKNASHNAMIEFLGEYKDLLCKMRQKKI